MEEIKNITNQISKATDMICVFPNCEKCIFSSIEDNECLITKLKSVINQHENISINIGDEVIINHPEKLEDIASIEDIYISKKENDSFVKVNLKHFNRSIFVPISQVVGKIIKLDEV